MAFQLVPRLCSILILLSIVSFSHAKAKLCKCRDSYLDRRDNHTIDNANCEFFRIDIDSGGLAWDIGRNLTGSEQKKTRVLSTIEQPIRLCQHRPDGLGVDEASFSVTIVYHPLPNQIPSGIAFLIIPIVALGSTNYGSIDTFWKQDDGSINLQRNATVHGSSVSVHVGELDSIGQPTGLDGVVMAIDINIDAGSAFTYAVWIDYDRVDRRLSVYVDLKGNPKPDDTIVEVNLNISGDGGVCFPISQFGLLSTAAQQLSVSRWNATVEDLPYYADKGGFLSGKVTILSSVFGSVTATAVMATVLACYFNSRYRRWHRDLDRLARSMERLPGVPTKVIFADIKKATGNFHETMKLGGGGFGTVYRCTLPATASKMERPMDVAVKRFTRDVQNRRYDDFLAEVSIINRLRHKNIVPLVGRYSTCILLVLVCRFSLTVRVLINPYKRSGYGTLVQQMCCY
jgi:interleukin-1 receptor-associated kinase 1